ncbi:hypothetical protein ACIA49_18320 [Kribbella sp. NPDC051587]|uniref:hypothetical protein n=1 Tax=Kribbella sp. NPDC051587 TaxID=3364119 RepID=UPI0037B96C79
MAITPSLMGEVGPEQWDAEYRRTGRVLFRPRRRALLSRRILLTWAVAILPSIGTFDEWDTRGTWFYIRVVGILLLLGSALAETIRLLRGQPILLVDTTGIRLGKAYVRWSSVASIGAPYRTFWAETLPINLTNEDWPDLDIPRDIVDDLSAFAGWLTHLHAERHP